MSGIITYENVRISPYRLTRLQELEIVKRVNEHSRLYLTGIVPEELKDTYVGMTDIHTNIEITQLDEQSNGIPLFSGLVTNIEIKAVRDIYYMQVEAVSHTYILDIRRRRRSFQDKNMSYSDMVQQMMADYPWVDFMDVASEGASIGKFTMQYDETDWQFLKRMSSRLSTGLVPASNFEKPKFYFGIPQGSSKGTLEDFNYSVQKKLANYRDSSENSDHNIDVNDFIYYEVETSKIMEIGSEVQFKEKSLYVSTVHTQMKNSVVSHVYHLCPLEGLYQSPIDNPIAGISIEGEVISVSKNNVKIHLEIDKKQSVGKATWFPYSSVYTAEGNTGWYVMPELGDVVKVYFPSNKEEEGYVLSSIRKDLKNGDSNKLENPQIKYFRTASGKELMFSPEEIVITGKDGEIYIRLNEVDGIEIFSKKPINFISEEDIIMDSQKKIIIKAEQEINMSCRDSSITMREGSTRFKGKDVKTN